MYVSINYSTRYYCHILLKPQFSRHTFEKYSDIISVYNKYYKCI
jgi:hypothetical protein